MYCPSEKKFRFSLRWFEDPGWTEQSAIDTIRHEYAHYMDHMLNDHTRPPHHGPKWKACCRAIGAIPERLYREEDERQFKKKNMEAASTAIRCGACEIGISIVHPTFGKGMIVGANGEGPARIIDVRFPEIGIKRLGAEWADKNCTKT